MSLKLKLSETVALIDLILLCISQLMPKDRLSMHPRPSTRC